MISRQDRTSRLWNVGSAWLVTGLVALMGCSTDYDSAVSVQATDSNTRGTTKQADFHAVATEDRGPQSVSSADDDSPVEVTLRLATRRARRGDTVALSVRLQMAAFWEIHAVGDEGGSEATRLELELPEGLKVSGPWQTPEPVSSIAPDGHAVYSGEVVFTRLIEVTDAAPAGEHDILCRVHYQACDERRCLRPTDVELVGRLEVE